MCEETLRNVLMDDETKEESCCKSLSPRFFPFGSVHCLLSVQVKGVGEPKLLIDSYQLLHASFFC